MNSSAVDPLPLRGSLAASIVAETCAERPTFLAQLVAMAFAARVADAKNGAGFLQLAAWAERACEQYGAFPAIAALLRAACAVTQHELRRRHMADASLESDLKALEATIAVKLAAAVASTEPNAHPSEGIDETIAAFLVQLDDADPLTAEHSRAVSLWCRRLARRMNLSDERGLFVARGGLLHDVGKTALPREILLAPRGLTVEEFTTIRTHATNGAVMVAAVSQLRPFVPLVGGHHERLDGRGYPDGLAAPDISLDVRIVTVADCFNAMIGRRLYRAPMSPATALEQLVLNSGSQFDPLVVEAMIDVIERPESTLYLGPHDDREATNLDNRLRTID